MVLTTESHMDYRVADLVEVMEAVDSPWLRHNFDFANSIPSSRIRSTPRGWPRRTP